MSNGTKQPNIILIMTDQERAPMHMEEVDLDAVLPGRARLRNEGISYENFYINSSPCTPNRSVMLTGLYTQQTWMCGNVDLMQSSLRTEFPTFAKALRDQGYETVYHGKCHFAENETMPNEGDEPTLDSKNALVDYGFNKYDPPHEAAGGKNQGQEEDPLIAVAAKDFITNWDNPDKPFLSVVSLVNPHDMMYYPRELDTSQMDVDYNPGVPSNFESLSRLESGKPSCQSQYRKISNLAFGKMPDDILTQDDKDAYEHCCKSYLWLQQLVDKEILGILETLDNKPTLKENTIVIFTSDHGEMAGSHGLLGKQCHFYEEAVRVPFYVVDYTGKWVAPDQRGTVRSRLASTIDIFPTLLGLSAVGTGEDYSFLPGVDLTANIADPAAPTRDYTLFAYDFRLPVVTAPDNILGIVEEGWKGAVYDYWRMDIVAGDPARKPEENVEIADAEGECELYKRGTAEDKLEMSNLADSYPQKMKEIKEKLYRLAKSEIRKPLPEIYQIVSHEAKLDYIKQQQPVRNMDFDSLSNVSKQKLFG